MTVFVSIILNITLIGPADTTKEFSFGGKPIGVHHVQKECTDMVDLLNKALPKGQTAVCIRVN